MNDTTRSRTNPYVGPRAYRRGEPLYGREHEVLDLLDLLIAERIVLLYSPSGAGKTSLVQAALIPRLEAEAFTVLPPVRVSLTATEALPPSANRYGLSALLSLDEALSPEHPASLAELGALSVGTYLERRAAAGQWGDFVLVFDQFEEILTLNPADRQAKADFFIQVGDALRNPRCWALFVMREEFVAGLDPYLNALPTRLSTTYRLELLGLSAAQAAMQGPARAAGVEFTDTAATRLAHDLATVHVQQPDGHTAEIVGGYVEPVQLQVVCRRLWDGLAPGDAEIGLDDLEQVGDVDSALRGYYADRVNAISRQTGIAEREIREWVDRQLITEQGIRGQVLQGPERSQNLDNRAIWLLVDAHLVRAEARRGATWFELAHDRLIEPVVADNAAWRQRHLSTLQRQAVLWQEQGRQRGLLWRGEVLASAHRWAAAHPDELSEAEHAFLADCDAEAQTAAEREALRARVVEEQRQRADEAAAAAGRLRRRARVIGGVAVLAVLLAIAAVWLAVGADKLNKALLIMMDVAATREAEALANAELAATREAEAREAQTRAEEQARLALARQLAAQAIRSIESPGIVERGLLLGVEAWRTTHDSGLAPVAEAADALRHGLDAAPVHIMRHDDVVSAAAFSPDGAWLATAGSDGTARVWDTATGEALAVLRHGDSVGEVACSPDGAWLATSSSDGTTRVWDMATGQTLVVLHHGDWINAVVFSPDGAWLTTAGADGSVRVWDAATGQELVALYHGDAVRDAAFSPDGARLATASSDTTARLWDLATGQEVAVLQHQDMVGTVVYSPDGARVATASEDYTVRLWDAATGQALAVLEHDGFASAAAFSPDGARLATASRDGTARIWDTLTGQELVVLRHRGAVRGVTYSPDGTRVATTSYEGTAWVWDATTGRELTVLRHDGWVSAVIYSPDGAWMATVSDDTTVRLWSTMAGQELAVLPHVDGVWDVDFSPDGTRVATGGFGDPARVWDAATGQELAALPHDDIVASVVFSPDGAQLATACYDHTARVWDTTTWQGLVVLEHEGLVWDVAYSPDATRLATASDDTTARLWDAATGQPLAVLRHDHWVQAVAFSPDGARLATASSDYTARLWDTTTGQELTVLRHDDSVNAVTFSPDGVRLATASRDQTARLWDTATGQQLAVLPHDGNVRTVSFSPDGTLLATASDDKSARVWEAATGRELAVVRHDGWVAAAIFSPDGALIATASDDQSARLWDATTAQELAVLRHDGAVEAVAFSPDGSQLASASVDGTARLWAVRIEDLAARACRIVSRNLTRDEWQQYLPGQPYRRTCEGLPEG